uniref:Uncharacterized protein n=1 Tax=viral metagenome TaxID=1070528 RepID=A0A6M3KYF1_9ZZZZ
MSISYHLSNILRANDNLSPKCPLAFFGKPHHHDVVATVSARHDLLCSVADSFKIFRLFEKRVSTVHVRLVVWYHLDDSPKDLKSFNRWHRANYGRSSRVRPEYFDIERRAAERAWVVAERDCQ